MIWKKVLSVVLSLLTVSSLVPLFGVSMIVSASTQSDPLINRVAQYCSDLDSSFVNQIKKYDLSNVDEYNKYAETMNRVNRSKKESRDLFYLAGDEDVRKNNGFAAHALRDGMANNLVLRGTLGLAGLIFNDELMGYAFGDNAGVEKYKSALQSFMNQQSGKFKLISTVKSINSYLKSISTVVDTVNANEVIMNLKLAVYQAKSVDDVQYLLKASELERILNGTETVEIKSDFTKAFGVVGNVLSITQITVEGIYNLSQVESNLQLYKSYEGFLNDIKNDKSLPTTLRMAASELYTDIDALYLDAIAGISQSIGKYAAGNLINLSVKEFGSTAASSTVGDLLGAYSVAKVLVGHLFSAKELVKGCSAIECYDILAEKYAEAVLKDKANFNSNPTLDNAEKFREDYEFLQQLRLTGEQTYLTMIGYDKSWNPAQRSLMRAVTGYKENKPVLQDNIDAINAAEFSMEDDNETYNLKIKSFYDVTADVQCPVNVNVYDKNDVLVASVIDNELQSIDADTADYPIVVYVEDDEKIVKMVSSNDYRIEIEAYDSGTMTYTSTKTTPYDELVFETSYESLSIYAGDTFAANPDDDKDISCRALYNTTEESLQKIEPTKDYDNKLLPEDEADVAEVVVAEDLFEGFSKELIDTVAGAMFSYADSVDVSSFNISTKDTVALFSAISKYYPSEYSILSKTDFTYRIVYSPSRGIITAIRFYYDSAVSSDSYQRRVNETNAAINALVAKTKGMSDFEKALYVHDYLILNCEYDLDLLEMLKANGTLDGEIYSERYTAYSVLVNGTGICGSYALAYRAVMNACGVECLYLSSDEMNHAWNLIKLDNKWYHVDCCWDDPVPDTYGVARRTYFLRTDDEIMELDHYSWTPGEYKATSSKYSEMPRYSDTKQKYDNGSWYFIESNSLYKSDSCGNNKQLVSSVTASTFDVEGGEIYYSYGRGIYEMSEGGGEATLSYYLPDKLCGSARDYAYLRNLYVEGDSVTAYRGVYNNDDYQYIKNTQSGILGTAGDLKLNYSSLTLSFLEARQLVCSLSQGSDICTVTPDIWLISDNTVASVNNSGLVTGQGNGQTQVKAFFNSTYSSCDVTVSFDESAVDRTPYLTYKIKDGKAKITDFDESVGGALVIPSELEGCPVTAIGSDAFKNCYALTSVVIPDSVISIGGFAFYGCTGLTSITIPDSVTSIEWYAFYGCTGLTSIMIPDSVKSIEIRAFDGCTGLTNISVDTGNRYYSSDSFGVLYNKDKTVLIRYPIGNMRSEFSIPDSVRSIGYCAFEKCTGLTNIMIPDSVTSIGSFAFYDCTGLTSITIPDSVTSIGQFAFYGCTGLTSITIPDSVISIEPSAFGNTGYYNDPSNWENDVLYIGNHLIEAKESLSGSYIIKNGTKTIAWLAFYKCKGLTNVMIPVSVTSIGESAFSGCDGLTSVTIGNSVTSIGYGTFDSCFSLTSITIPDSVTSIDNCAFMHCTGLTSITIPDSVTSIGEHAFDNTGYYNDPSNWENDVLYIGNYLIDAKTSLSGSYIVKNGTKTIADYAFFCCTGLTNITIPDSVTSIGDSTFENCTGLKSVTIGNSVTSIGFSAFESCTCLTSITIPDSVTSIKIDAFCNTGYYNDPSNWENEVLYIGNHLIESKALSGSYTVKNGTKTIGNSAFYCRTELTSITIPDSVTSIGRYAFDGCNTLSDVYYSGTREQWNSIGIGPGNDYLLNAEIHYNYGDHKHSYTSTVTEPASCTEDGLMTYTCSCGKSYTETISATGHSYKLVSITQATCFEPPVSEFECEICHDRITVVGKETEKHTYVITIHSATCTEAGYTEGVCSGCDDSVMFDFVAPLGHDLTVKRIPATCKEHAMVEYLCSRCGYHEIVIDNDSAYAYHSYEQSVTPPGCTSQGFTTHTCSGCGDSYTDTYVPANGHTDGEWKVLTPATVTSEGIRALYCKDCGEIIRTESIPKLEPVGKVNSVSVDNIEMNYKNSATFNPVIDVDEGVNYTVTYTSSDPSVAKVDENGNVYGAKKGSADITVTVTDEYGNSVSDTCTVKVTYSFWQWVIMILLFGWIWY